MSHPLSIECDVHFERVGHGAQKHLSPGPAPLPAPPRIPRLAKLMALALRFDRLVRTGVVPDFASLARAGHVTRARMCQIVALVHLAPDIVEAILHLPPVESGRDPLVLRDVRPIAAVADWAVQRRMWKALAAERGIDLSR